MEEQESGLVRGWREKGSMRDGGRGFQRQMEGDREKHVREGETERGVDGEKKRERGERGKEIKRER